MYKLNANLYSSVFVVPSVIVEKYIKMASFCAIKSLLWILKNQGSNYSVEEIAKAIGSSAADTKEALEYWANEGILIKDGEINTIPSPIKSDSHLKKEEPVKAVEEKDSAPKVSAPEIKIVRPTLEQVITRMNEDKTINGLLNQAQVMLGRSIGFDLQSSVLMMIDTYGLPIEVILELFQYCIDIGKSSNAYILSVAKAWFEKDITTLEKVHQYIDEHNNADKIFKEFAQFTGITSPKATPKQTEYLIKWSNLGFSVNMMVLAYNEGAERTGKISFPYIDKVLLNWHEQGFKTPEDVENAKKEFKNNKTSNSSKRSYDIDKAVNDARNAEIVYKKKEKR